MKKSAAKKKKTVVKNETPAPFFRIPPKLRSWIRESQFLATTLSIILTFGTTGLLENCQRIKDRKLSAMMVMSNIEQFSRNVDQMSQNMARCDSIGAWMLSLPIDSLDDIPPAEVRDIINEVLRLVNPLTHDKTAESIFSNNIETWKNMEKFLFIDKVGSCFSEMNAAEKNWNEWVNDYEMAITQAIGQMNPGDHTLTVLLKDNMVRQKIESFHVRKAWLDYISAHIRYYNNRNMIIIGIPEHEVMAFTDERARSVDLMDKEPMQSDFRKDTLCTDSLYTLQPLIQHIDSIMHKK